MIILPLYIDRNRPEPRPSELSPVALSIAQEIRVGREFKINGKRNKGKVFTVINILREGFQYGIQVNGKWRETSYLSFREADRITLIPGVDLQK